MRSREHIERKAAVMSRALDELTPTYENQAQNPISTRDLPSEAEVLRAAALLDDIFYPGYRSVWPPDVPIETLIIESLNEAYDLLYRQVMRALPLRSQSKFTKPEWPDLSTEEALSAEAERVVSVFFARMPHVREMLKNDVIAAYFGDPAAHSYDEIALSYPGIRAITTHRVAHELYCLDVPLIPRLMSEDTHRRTGIDIHPGANIGESFFIDHGTGVVIGETTIIGNRVRLYHGVTLGARSVTVDEQGHPTTTGKRHPTLEDDVIIYPGATILGGDTVVGRGAIVNGNVFLTRSVPPGEVVTQRSAWARQVSQK